MVLVVLDSRCLARLLTTFELPTIFALLLYLLSSLLIHLKLTSKLFLMGIYLDEVEQA